MRTMGTDVRVSVRRGAVPDALIEHARDRVARLARTAPAPVLDAHVVLAVESNPALERPCVVKANLDVNGRLVRAHVAATQMREAIDLAAHRLDRELAILAGRRLARRQAPGVATAGSWRRGTIPTHRPEYFPRPPEERELVRRKTYSLRPLDPGDAVEEMELLDHDWHLYTDRQTGADALLEEHDDGYVLTVIGDRLPESHHGDRRSVELRAGAPTMSVDDALDALDESGERRVFLVDAETGRGCVVYRRYDGHYGLVTAAAPEAGIG